MERKQNWWGHHPSFLLFKVYALIKVLASAPEYTRNVTPVCISTQMGFECTLRLPRKFCVLGLRCYCPAGCCGIISSSSQAPVRLLRRGSSAGKSRKALQKIRELCSFVSTEKLLHISSFHFCLPGWEDCRGSDLPFLPMGNQTEGKVFQPK